MSAGGLLPVAHSPMMAALSSGLSDYESDRTHGARLGYGGYLSGGSDHLRFDGVGPGGSPLPPARSLTHGGGTATGVAAAPLAVPGFGVPPYFSPLATGFPSPLSATKAVHAPAPAAAATAAHPVGLVGPPLGHPAFPHGAYAGIYGLITTPTPPGAAPGPSGRPLHATLTPPSIADMLPLAPFPSPGPPLGHFVASHHMAAGAALASPPTAANAVAALEVGMALSFAARAGALAVKSATTVAAPPSAPPLPPATAAPLVPGVQEEDDGYEEGGESDDEQLDAALAAVRVRLGSGMT
jgi:hypothetical protein